MGRHENIQGPYSPESLARRWDVSAETIRQMTHRGELPSFRVGRNIRIPCDIVPVRDQWFVDQQGGIVGCRTKNQGPAGRYVSEIDNVDGSLFRYQR